MNSAAEGAAREALNAFGVEPRAVTLASRSENITFHVEAAPGDYALRLHRPDYNTLAELISERVWTAALSRVGFAVPVGVKTPDGRDYVAVPLEGGEVRVAGLTCWTPGVVLANALEKDHQDVTPWFARLGAIAADLHAHSAAWRAPAGFTRRVLDADGLMGEAPLWGQFWAHPILKPGEATLMAQTRARLHEALSALPRAPETWGMIHADLHHGNLLIDGGALSVIDFDDAGFGWYLYDLAVALAHWMDRANFAELQGALLAGYRQRRAMGPQAEALLPMFLLTRRLAVIGWLHQRPEFDATERLRGMLPFTLALCEGFLNN